MTSKQRAYLKGLAMTMDPILQLGKGGLTPENTAAVEEALAARELIKISVLQNCLEDPREMAQVLAERTRSHTVPFILEAFSILFTAFKTTCWIGTNSSLERL